MKALPSLDSFPYLRRTITYNNIKWAAVYQKLSKARRWWVMVARVLSNTVSMVQARGIMYKAVEQLVLLYISETWVVTGYMIKVLEVFHHRSARCIMGMIETRGAGRDWEYPLVVA